MTVYECLSKFLGSIENNQVMAEKQLESNLQMRITGLLFIICLYATNSPAIAQANGGAGDIKGVSYKASQLSGINLPIEAVSKTGPLPVLFQITGSVVKGTTSKGCFALGEAQANISTLRADVKIVSLSCLGTDGKNTKNVVVEGFVVDSDGKRGLKGNVYANNFGGELLEVKPSEVTVVITSEAANLK